MKKNGLRVATEVGFILFLFYANLLMGEFERSGAGQRRGFVWAFEDVFTVRNFLIGLMAATIGYAMIEFLRRRS